jgi:hypothetical protein
MQHTTNEPLNGLSLNAERKLSDGGLRPLADLIDLLGIGHRVAGRPSRRRSDHPIFAAKAGSFTELGDEEMNGFKIKQIRHVRGGGTDRRSR